MFNLKIEDSYIQFVLPEGEMVSVDDPIEESPGFSFHRKDGSFLAFLEAYRAPKDERWHAVVTIEGGSYRLYGDGELERIRSASPSLEEKLAKQPVPIQVFFRPEEDED